MTNYLVSDHISQKKLEQKRRVRQSKEKLD